MPKIALKRTKSEIRADKKRFRRITRKGEPFLPSNLKKYTGNVKYHPRYNTWRVRIQKKNDKFHTKSYQTKEEAEAHLKRYNVRKELKIKNIIYVYKGQCYCVLTQHQLLKFSSIHCDLVDKYTWYAQYNDNKGSFYVTTSNMVEENGRLVKQGLFSRMICPGITRGETCIYDNDDTLDCSTENIKRVFNKKGLKALCKIEQ